MKRRTFLGAAGTAAAASSFPAPAIAQGIRELKLVASWTRRGFHRAPDPFVQRVTVSSGGRLKVKSFAAGEMVGAFEVFDAVSQGVADMYYSVDFFWHERSPAFNFFTSVPFGLTAGEMNAWIYYGGGQELWDELSANFNLKPFPAGNHGVEMGGWFNREITSIESFKGLRLRMAGLGGQILRRLGAFPVLLPAPEIVPAMKSGALDAAQFAGPQEDLEVGLHTVAKFYYYPGFQEPGNLLSLGVNRKLWESLRAEEQSLIATAAEAANSHYTASLQAHNMKALAMLLDKHGVKLRKFDDAMLRTFGKLSGEVVAEVGASDPFTRRVYESYIKFRNASRWWTDISERAYLNARALEFPYGI